MRSSIYPFLEKQQNQRETAVQVNLCQKLLFLHQLNRNMTIYCSLNYKFQAQTWGEHVYTEITEQFLYTTCSPHVLQKEDLLTKIYLYRRIHGWAENNDEYYSNDCGPIDVLFSFQLIQWKLCSTAGVCSFAILILHDSIFFKDGKFLE